MYRCYVCDASVSDKEHLAVRTKMDNLPEPQATEVVDALGLIHCTPDEAQADSDGAVVVCERCYAYGIAAR